MIKRESEIIADELGPQYIVEVNSLKPRFKGFLIIDNLVRGPGKGGIRMSADLTLAELFRLARTMTFKNALFDLPFGGAKAGLVVDPRKVSLTEKKAIIQAFAKLLKPFVPDYYIAGPDLGTGEQEMKWFAQALGFWQAATGKPKDFCLCLRGKCSCGLPHELGSTGLGVAVAAKTAVEVLAGKIQGKTTAVAGFGSVGSFSAKHLAQMGARIIAISDKEGTIFNQQGLDLASIEKLKAKKQPLSKYPGAKIFSRDKIYELAVDILIPAAVSDVINEKNWRKVKAKIIVEAANIPIPEEIEGKLWRRGIVIVPDFVANAGGVISSFAEWKGYPPERMFEIVERKINRLVRRVLSESLRTRRNPREVSLVMARKNLKI